ncbi:alpha-ketoglutarate-dependent dioxygenase AlkB [Algivirga pacifica]|uniref:Alpha-ketoglutarate-dependent dioxygenase AlkB n=1 Tax=Algivirga pacifica TaxID=1162670 RepID=A0ABP9D9Y0_9BACT
MKQISLGDGELLYDPNFLSPEEADTYIHQLMEEIIWKQEEIKLFGKVHPLPRKTAWYGDKGITYTYSGLQNQPERWSPTLLTLKERIENLLEGPTFNSVLLNWYRDGNDKMGWHSDDEPSLGRNPVIASISLGAPRFFDLRHKKDKTRKHRLELTSGSLLVMQGELQHHWVHQVPVQKRVKEGRINLTFRDIKFP